MLSAPVGSFPPALSFCAFRRWIAISTHKLFVSGLTYYPRANNLSSSADDDLSARKGQSETSIGLEWSWAEMSKAIQISAIEVMALKKLALINGALAKTLTGTASREQTALLSVLVDVIGRAELANATAETAGA